MNKMLCICRVCGYENDHEIWGQDGRSPTYNICPCCGVEFGYEDYTLESLKNYRIKWINGGKKWFEENLKPDNWDFKSQMLHIPREYI